MASWSSLLSPLVHVACALLPLRRLAPGRVRPPAALLIALGLLAVASVVRSPLFDGPDPQLAVELVSAAAAVALALLALRREWGAQRFAEYFRRSPDAVFIADAQARYIDVNPAATELTGFTRDQLLSMSIPDLAAADAPDEGPAHFRRLLETGHSSGEVALRHADGRRIFVTIDAEPLGDGRFIAFCKDTTERRLALERIAASESRLELAQRAGRVGSWSTEPGASTSWWSPGLFEMLELDPQSVEPSEAALVERVTPDERTRLQELLEALHERGTAVEGEFRFAGGERPERHVILRARRVPEAGGGVVGALVDVTALRRAERAHRESERRLAAVFQTSPVGILQWRPDGTLQFANERARQFLGEDTDPFTGRGWLAAVMPSERPWAEREWRAAVASGSPYRAELAFRAGEDDVHPVLVEVTPICGDGATQRERLGFVGCLTSLADLRRAESELVRQKHYVESVLEVIGSPVVVLDPAGRIRSFNRACEELTGYSRDEARHQLIWDLLLLPEERGQVERDLAALDAVEFPSEHTHHWVTRSGETRLLAWVYTCLLEHDGSVRFVVGIGSDITDRRRREERRRKLEQEIQRTRRLDAIGNLAGGVAHDFNNLLTAMLGGLERMRGELEAEGALAPAAAEEFERVESATERCVELVRKLLQFGGRQETHPERLDPSAVIEAALPIIRGLVREDIELRLSCPAGLPPVEADRVQLEQAVVNLIVNAVEATPGPGEIEIAVSVSPAATDVGSPAAGAASREEVRLSVRDTGVGMDEPTRARVFEPFFTRHELAEGRGLGLASVHGAVTRWGGRVDVESRPGRGSTFTIALPVAGAAPVDPHPERGDSAQSFAGGTEAPDAVAGGPRTAPPEAIDDAGEGTILLVEDNAAVRHVCALALQRQGFQVLEAMDASVGLRLVAAHAGQVDLVVTDVVMPGVNGLEMVQRLRERQPQLPALFISGYPAEGSGAPIALQEDVEMLHKPFAPQQLIERVRKLIAGGPA